MRLWFSILEKVHWERQFNFFMIIIWICLYRVFGKEWDIEQQGQILWVKLKRFKPIYLRIFCLSSEVMSLRFLILFFNDKLHIQCSKSSLSAGSVYPSFSRSRFKNTGSRPALKVCSSKHATISLKFYTKVTAWSRSTFHAIVTLSWRKTTYSWEYQIM